MEFAFNKGAVRRIRIAAPPGFRFPPAPPATPDAGEMFRLDSALADGRLGRFSHAGAGPVAVLTGRRRQGAAVGLDLALTVHREPDGAASRPPRRWTGVGDPYEALRALRAAYGDGAGVDGPLADPPAGPPSAAPFAGGLVGWFGYGLAWATEALPPARRAPDAGDVPDLLFMVFDDVLCHDHADGATTLVVTGRGADDAAAARDLDAQVAGWRDRLAITPAAPDAGVAADPHAPAGFMAASGLDAPADLTGITAACDEPAYLAAVARCREHILGGDAFEICLTQQLSAPFTGRPEDLYATLRAVNPAPFAALIRAGDIAIVGASPERFLGATRDGALESRPIKGTRPRGATPADDARLRRELADSEKDRAENLMIVDLVRSDLGRVARIGSVTVPELCAIESYATVHQMVSTVRAELKEGCDALDAVKACFPGGSMTGAPKLEAMAIIDRLEPAPRGVYAGALGWLGWDGAMDLNIVIRTFVCAGGRASFGVGGAVTADSDPAAEYRESLDKARALLAALRLAALRLAARDDNRKDPR